MQNPGSPTLFRSKLQPQIHLKTKHLLTIQSQLSKGRLSLHDAIQKFESLPKVDSVLQLKPVLGSCREPEVSQIKDWLADLKGIALINSQPAIGAIKNPFKSKATSKREL